MHLTKVKFELKKKNIQARANSKKQCRLYEAVPLDYSRDSIQLITDPWYDMHDSIDSSINMKVEDHVWEEVRDEEGRELHRLKVLRNQSYT